MTIADPSAHKKVEQVTSRSDLEHAALRELLQAAKRAEEAATDAGRREAYRNTRSLIGAARQLGFTARILAEMLEITEGTLRSRIGPALPMLPSAFLALTPASTASVLTDGIGDFGHGSERASDSLKLLRWYLLGDGDTNRAA